MVEKARADFQSKVKLLGGYYSWDRRQLPIYVKRRRLSRALFEPMLIAFTGMRSERKLGEYRVGQLVVSLHRSGVACLTMWISPAKTKPAISLRAEDILEITRRLNEVTVEVGLAKQISETAQKLNSTFGLRLTRRKDLDAKANQTELASSYNAQYEVWEGSLAKLLDLYRVLIGSLSLELMGKASTRDNLRTFRGVSALGYSILHLYDFGHTISNPFEEVVKVYPRQISGILIRDRLFTNNTTQYTVFSLVDVSLREGLSSMFSASKSLTIYSSHNWNRLEEENKTRVLWWPGMAQIATTAQWEMLCSLRQLLEGYNVLLEDVSVEGGTIADLIGAEAKITRGLEEIYAATHARYRSVGYWWQLAEDELWINELEKVVRQKLEDTHMMIVTTTDRQVNRRLLWLTIVTTALTALTVVAGFQEIWRILQAFWNVATQVFLPKQNAFTYQYYLDLFSCAVTRVLTDCVSL
jgi:hypothetical protein